MRLGKGGRGFEVDMVKCSFSWTESRGKLILSPLRPISDRSLILNFVGMVIYTTQLRNRHFLSPLQLVA
jgi:hypothetical protein